MSKEVLIAGGNGFLGSALVQQCLAQGWTVDVLVNKSRNRLPEGIREVKAAESLGEWKGRSYDYIFNAAAFIPYGAYDKPDEQLLDANVELVMTLHKQFPAARYVFASSVSVYGNNLLRVNEDSDCISPNKYGMSKLCGEFIVSHHKSYAVLRFSSLYGRGMYGGTFIPRVIADAKTKKEINLLGAGERRQNYLHVQDAAGYCIHAAIMGENRVYLGVCEHEYSNKEVAGIIAENIEGCSIAYMGEDRSPSFLYDNSLTRSALQYQPVISLAEGLKDLINE